MGGPIRMRRPARGGFAAAMTLLLIGAAGCASTDTTSNDSAASCAKDRLHLYHQGVLTIGTDTPAYEPWVKNNSPASGQGYEAAVAYAVAGDLGFRRDEVKWTVVHFNDS